MTLVRSQLLIHCGGNECLPGLFRRHLPLQRQTTAPCGIRADIAVRTDHVPAKYFEALKWAAYRLFDAATKCDGHRLPTNFRWIADLIRVHFLTPRLLPGPKLVLANFVPAKGRNHEMVIR